MDRSDLDAVGLLPCPFCGGERVSVFGPYGWYRQYGISHSCKSFYSGTEMMMDFGSKADAIAAWNTRASLSPSPALSDGDAELCCYDAGLLGDGGGGDVDWWQDYMRAELARAHDFYADQFSQLSGEIAGLREERDKAVANERARIVAWIRLVASLAGPTRKLSAAALRITADDIEAGRGTAASPFLAPKEPSDAAR